jgi:hypothetical protein
VVDYQKLFNTFYKRKYKEIPLIDDVINLDGIFDKNKSSYVYEDVEIIEPQSELRSLLYFDDCKDYLVDKISEVKVEKDDVELDLSSDELDVEEFLNKDYNIVNNPQKGRGIKSYNNNRVSNPYFYDRVKTRETSKIGSISEKNVYEKLVSMYGEDYVLWDSRLNGGLHYDIKYSKTKGESWIFIDVKTFNNGKFYLTPDEKEFGEMHKEQYEIWLINSNGQIKVLKDFFIKDLHNIVPQGFIVYIEY